MPCIYNQGPVEYEEDPALWIIDMILLLMLVGLSFILLMEICYIIDKIIIEPLHGIF